VDLDGRTTKVMGVDFADYYNVVDQDIVVTDANSNARLYRNNGDGSFSMRDATGISKMTLPHSGWGVRFLGTTMDGWKIC